MSSDDESDTRYKVTYRELEITKSVSKRPLKQRGSPTSKSDGESPVIKELNISYSPTSQRDAESPYNEKGLPRGALQLRGSPTIKRDAESPNNKKDKSCNESEEGTKNPPILIVILGIIIAGVAVWIYYPPFKTCSNSFEDIQNKFISQRSEALLGIETSLVKDEKLKVKSLVLMHDENGEETAHCLAILVARAFSCGNFHNLSVTTLTASELNEADSYGKFLSLRRETLDNAVIIKNLDEVNSEKAQMFHTMCDDINPYKEPSLYIFTLPTSKTAMGLKPSEDARKILENKWSNLDHNILDPLLNRILGFVIRIKNEIALSC